MWRSDLVPMIADGVSSHLFEDQLLVFSERHQKLYALNRSAALIWSSFENRMSCREVVETLVSTYGIDGDQARVDVATALNEWVTVGLVCIDAADRQDLASEATDTDVWLDAACSHSPPTTDTSDGFRLSLLGSEFLIRCASRDMSTRLDEVFGHLASTSSGPVRIVDIVESDNRFRIYAPGVPAVEGIDEQHLISTLTQTVLRSAYRNCDFLIAVHAAVLSLGRECVILSGQSGNGKSTLAAALIKRGFTYFTDEVALVDRAKGHVVPAPVSLRIKESGWDIVATMFPQVYRLPCHVLTDGSRLRYLRPPAGSFAKGLGDACPARWLVFPRYSPGEESALVPISRVDAISRLQSTGYDIGGLLDRTKITEILSWLKRIDCFEMKVNQLDGAAALLRSLVS